jgi:hypothetical protein
MTGFIAGKWRPDAQLGFIAIAQQFAINFTAYTRGRVVQLSAYLLGSREFTLTFRPSPDAPGPTRALAIEHWSDSSALNAGAGLSWGGGCSGVRGSGLVSWKSFAPKKPVDSSGAAELIAATFTNKFGQGTRMFVKEFCMGALIHWAFNIDAPSALAGVGMERVSDRMRHIAARYAMLRYSEEVTADIKLQKCTSAANTAGGFTKPLTGPAFLRSRAQMLGHDAPQALAKVSPAQNSPPVQASHRLTPPATPRQSWT